MIENGIEDYGLAKRKAMQRLHVDSRTPMPANSEIEQARTEYQRLFRADEQSAVLTRLRLTAIKVMMTLIDFSPKLIGPVLTGTADEHSGIELLVQADPPERLSWFLMERRLAHKNVERRVRFSREQSSRLPGVEVFVDGIEVELLILSGKQRARVPLSPVDGRPMRRANLKELQALLDTG